jgi:hypothetical protein
MYQSYIYSIFYEISDHVVWIFFSASKIIWFGWNQSGQNHLNI